MEHLATANTVNDGRTHTHADERSGELTSEKNEEPLKLDLPLSETT